MTCMLRIARSRAIFAALLVTGIAWSAAFAAPDAKPDDNMFSLTSGFDYTAGGYVANPSEILLTPATTNEYEAGKWMFKVAAPYARVPAAVSAPGTGRVRPGVNVADTLSDAGDTVAAASYHIYSGRASTFGIDLTGKVKLKAGESVCSGQNDYAAQAAAYQSFNRFTALGSLGFKFLASSPAINMNKVLYGSFGGAYQLDDKLHGGVDLSLSQSPSLTGDGHRELTAYVSRKIGKDFTAKGYVLKGFSNNSPDSTLGAQVRYGF